MNMIGFGFIEMLLMALLLAPPIKAPLPPPDAAAPIPKLELKRSAERTAFYDTVKYLDLGGQFLLYLSAEQALADMALILKRAEEVVQALTKENGEADAREARMVLKLVQAGLKESGVSQISGLGASSIATQRGFHRSAAMLHRYPDNKEPGILWTGLGQKPHAQTGLQLLPASTVLALHGDVDAQGAMVWLKKFIAVHAPAEVAREFAQALVEINREVNLDNLLAGYAGEVGLLVTLDEKRRFNMPLPHGGAALELPVPGMALVLKTKGPAFPDLLKKALDGLPLQAAEPEEAEGVKLNSYKVPGELPLDIRPTWFVSGDYLILCSSPALAKEILAVQKGRNKGLSGTAEFQRLAKGLELEGNHLHFVSVRLAQTYLDVGQSILERAMKEEELPGPLGLALKGLLGEGRNHLAGYLGVLRVQADGLLYTSHTSRSVAPAGAGTGGGAHNAVALLAPALLKARAAARTSQDMNQLKQLLIAAHIAAADDGDRLPDAARWCEALGKHLPDAGAFEPAQESQSIPGKKRVGFAMNATLSGLKLRAINHPSETVLFFESDPGWSGKGGRDDMKLSSDGACLVGMVDGSVRRVSKAQRAALRWEP